MKSKSLFWLLATVLLTTVSLASAQQTKKVARIAYLGAGSALNPGPDPGPDALVRLGSLRRGLRELGYEEGKNIIIEYRTAAGRPDRIPGIVAELARLKTAVIVWSAGQEEARQVKTIPIVYVATSDFVAKNRLPAMYSTKDFVEAGGLMSYGQDIIDNWRRAATFVDKILKGAKPSDLPVEQAMKFEFIVNLIAAKQIGLTIPPQVLARADRVIR